MYEYNLGLKFEEIVRLYPNNIALKFVSGDKISYRKLNEKVNQLANFLLKNGLKTKDVVCISGTKNLTTYACMLACLKIGAVYAIIDNRNPVERLEKIITRCTPKIMFLDSELAGLLNNVIKRLKINVVNNNSADIEGKTKKLNKNNLEITRLITSLNPAYIMFTSGSTGFPKGALMTHSNLLNLIAWSIQTYNIVPTDTLTNVNPLYFDNSVFDFSSALFSGASLASFPREVVVNSVMLVKKVDELKCTLWFSVPSLLIYLNTMKVLTKNNLRYIKRFVFGGEGYPKPKLKQLFELYSSRSEFYNVYGPTECTCICSSYKVTKKDFLDLGTLAPLGKIAGNFTYLILDEIGNKVALNKIGELCLLGPNVGIGYYNDLSKTKDKFVQNPLNKYFREIMYKTGDLVMYNSREQNIYFVGRKDNQIKHMGYRIELDEIELALNRLHNISQAAVIHGYKGRLSQIIAIVSSAKTVEERAIRVQLKRKIPDYMIPNKIYVLKELPKNPNGKIDRKKLADFYLPKES